MHPGLTSALAEARQAELLEVAARARRGGRLRRHEHPAGPSTRWASLTVRLATSADRRRARAARRARRRRRGSGRAGPASGRSWRGRWRRCRCRAAASSPTRSRRHASSSSCCACALARSARRLIGQDHAAGRGRPPARAARERARRGGPCAAIAASAPRDVAQRLLGPRLRARGEGRAARRRARCTPPGAPARLDASRARPVAARNRLSEAFASRSRRAVRASSIGDCAAQAPAPRRDPRRWRAPSSAPARGPRAGGGCPAAAARVQPGRRRRAGGEQRARPARARRRAIAAPPARRRAAPRSGSRREQADADDRRRRRRRPTRRRDAPDPVPCRCRATTRIAEAARLVDEHHPLAEDARRRSRSAAAIVSERRRCRSADGSLPTSAAATSPTPIPSVTPTTICTIRRPRRMSVVLSEIAAAIGAKNGCAWPSASCAMNHASTAASAACTGGHSERRSRCRASDAWSRHGSCDAAERPTPRRAARSARSSCRGRDGALDQRREHGPLPHRLRVARQLARAGRPGRRARGCSRRRPRRPRPAVRGARRRRDTSGERERLALAEAQEARGASGGARQADLATTISPCSSVSSERSLLGRDPVELEQRRARARPRAERTDERARRSAASAGARSEGCAEMQSPASEAVLAVVADLRVAGVAAAQPAVPLHAAEVPAARALAEVAADRADVAQQRRGGERRRRVASAAYGASSSEAASVGERRAGADREPRRRRHGA